MIARRVVAVILLAALSLASLFGCSDAITASCNVEATRIAFYPTATAAAQRADLEATCVAVLGAELAQLQYSRTLALNDTAVAQAYNILTETHQANLALISSTYAYSRSEEHTSELQ